MQAADDAAETVHHAIAEDGDVNAALRLLKELGMLDGERRSVGITDPTLIRLDRMLAYLRQQKVFEALERRVAVDRPANVESLRTFVEVLEIQFEQHPDEPSQLGILKRFVERAVEEGALDKTPSYALSDEAASAGRLPADGIR